MKGEVGRFPSCGGGGADRIIAGGWIIGPEVDSWYKEGEARVVSSAFGRFPSESMTVETSGFESISTSPAGPGVGFRPSRYALAMSAAFHFE